MTCERFRNSAILEAYGESAAAGWKRHLSACEACSSQVHEILEVRRLYAQVRPVRLNDRVKRSILSRIRSESRRRVLRSAMTTLAAVGAAFLLVAGLGGAPEMMAAAAPIPTDSVIELGLADVRVRVAALEAEPPSDFDSSLEDLKARVGSLTWDTENM